jgi:DNA-directed RNA polymerase specialized sigma24 family protein
MKDMLLQGEPLIPMLRRYPRALLRGRAAADDLVQDCLERAPSAAGTGGVTARSAPGFSPAVGSIARFP